MTDTDDRGTGSPPPDTLGIVAVVAGVLGLGGCVGTFVPYIGVLFMMGSMAVSTMGLAIGAIGLSQRKAASLPTELSTGGVVINGVVLALWVLYWVLVVLAMILILVFGAAVVGFLIVAEP